jgi:hypothetical protein
VPGEIADGDRDFREDLITIRPGDHGLAVARKGSEMRERRRRPIDGANQDRNDDRLTLRVALEGQLDFDVRAVLGGEKVGADQKKDDLGRAEV